MTSLRLRVLVLVAILLAFTAAATTMLSSRFAAERFEDLIQDGGSRLGDPALAELIRDWPGDRDSAVTRLAGFSAASRRPVIWLREDGPGIAFHEGRPIVPAIATRGADLEVSWTGAGGDVRVLVFSVDAGLPTPHGGRLYAGPSLEGGHLVHTAVTGMNRSLVIAAILVGLTGVVVAFPLSTRIFGPVASLTRAARRMEEGDLATRVAVSSRDELGALAQAFNAMAERIDRTERLRRDLVTDVAHELRTPLTNLRAQLEAVQDGLLAPDATTVASLRDEVALLQRVVDDLQEVALAEAGRLVLEPAALAPDALLAGAASAVSVAASAAGVEVVVEPSGALPAVRADPRRVAQVMRNLIGNALTHTPRGGQVLLSAAPAEGAVRFVVRDTGPGIAPADLPHVFERFWRADRSRDRATGGTGLGLAIVQQLVRAHGGEVRVESRPGHGATFWFTLPLA